MSVEQQLIETAELVNAPNTGLAEQSPPTELAEAERVYRKWGKG